MHVNSVETPSAPVKGSKPFHHTAWIFEWMASARVELSLKNVAIQGEESASMRLITLSHPLVVFITIPTKSMNKNP